MWSGPAGRALTATWLQLGGEPPKMDMCDNDDFDYFYSDGKTCVLLCQLQFVIPSWSSHSSPRDSVHTSLFFTFVCSTHV